MTESESPSDPFLFRPAGSARTILPPGPVFHDSTSFLNSLARFAGYALFFLMMFLPAAARPLKGGFILLVLAAFAFRLTRTGRLAIDPVVLAWTTVITTGSLLFIAIGLAHDAPGALRVGSVYVLWPWLYTIFVGAAARRRTLDALQRVMVITSIAISLYAFSFILHSLGWLPDALFWDLDPNSEVGFYDGFMKLRMNSVNLLLFLVPFLAASIITWPGRLRFHSPRWLTWMALVMSAALVPLIGRRAMLLVVALSPFLALAFRRLLPRRDRAASKKKKLLVWLGGIALLTLAIVGVGQRLDISPKGLLSIFEVLLDPETRGESVDARISQADALLNEWWESPVFGKGHGAAARGSVRDSQMPYAYELSYLALLFHTGIVGVCLYSAGIVWIFWMGFRIIRHGGSMGYTMVPMLVGMSCFLLANATNAYLESYDHLWIIFLPVAVINYWLLAVDPARKPTPA